MQNTRVHEIELYPPEIFKTIVDHEVNRSHRYGDSLTLANLVVETDPANEKAQHTAELFAINVLNLHLRQIDIACQKGNEFLVLMPATSAQGARTACERLRRLMTTEQQTVDNVFFKILVFIGMATLPIDRSVSSNGLIENTSKALQHARTNRLARVISFSEIKE
ncbi:MAG TPA: diguanylate cyclase [Anaerolineales bacterium]|nr:diguanylate cyclase [Anaerolineales bacterium]